MARKRLSLVEHIQVIEKVITMNEQGISFEELALLTNLSPVYLQKLLKIAMKKGNIVEKDGVFYLKQNYYKKLENSEKN
jgi:hypothetical protein